MKRTYSIILKKMKNNILIAGAGDVGKTLASILGKKYAVHFVDLRSSKNIDILKIDVLHICFPYNKHFIRNASAYIQKFKPRITIINSTVAVGTTSRIIRQIHSQAVVHSPVIGDHSKLALGISTFTKAIGAKNKYYGQKASNHFKFAGLKTKVFSDSKTTELGKLLLTTQFALNIAFHQEMERMCKKTDVDFDKTVQQFKSIFNDGYCKIRPNVVMPNLFPGKIMGTCLMQNIEILKEHNQSEFLKAIEASNDKKKK